MKRLPYERPTDHYDMKVMKIDEQLCELLRHRKEISQNNPGYPPFEFIKAWAASSGLYEEYLKVLFGMFMNEHHFKPVVEPSGFRKHIAALQSVENNGFFYTITAVKQYENASVVTLFIDWDASNEAQDPMHSKAKFFELDLGVGYVCRFDGGNSSSGHSSNNFVVTPPLPDNLSGIKFVFKLMPAPNQGTDGEIVLRVK
ncbi:hypothetical protein [Paenibacillus kobensis]|uniref:hypothetical protein n=1 Tax=Paenibacillus kobensis TaxID=59841 RepID=UPI000FDBE269|nr:hypothetical protein [Paenibacillus kobensis]